MEMHVRSMISWFKTRKPCERLVLEDVDPPKSAQYRSYRVSLQMLIFTCCALEKIPLFPIM